MQLQNISLGKLITAAGGDPWAVNNSIQSGHPEQIADLAQAFHNAGQCTTESRNAFADARSRFEASWNRETGEHPINDSAEYSGLHPRWVCRRPNYRGSGRIWRMSPPHWLKRSERAACLLRAWSVNSKISTGNSVRPTHSNAAVSCLRTTYRFSIGTSRISNT